MSIIWQLLQQPLLHVFIRSIVCMSLFWFCLSFLQKLLFFLFLLFNFLLFILFLFFMAILCSFPPLFVLFLCSLLLVGCLFVCDPLPPGPVLEFELRKAKETIQALRANLTQAAGGVLSTFTHFSPFCYRSCSHSWMQFCNVDLKSIFSSLVSLSLCFFFLCRMRDCLSREKKLQIQSWNSGCLHCYNCIIKLIKLIMNN